MRRLAALASAAALSLASSGCYHLKRSAGGGQRVPPPESRRVSAEDVAVPLGYRIERVAEGLTFPTAVVFDDSNRLHVVEAGYSYGEAWAAPRLLRLDVDDRWITVAEGDKNGPWTGADFRDGMFYVAEGGALEGGRILRIHADGKRVERLVEGLPSRGDHHTNGPVVGPDGLVYFAQGVATNSGVVGDDNEQFGWLGRFPDFHDVPCEDVTLTGLNFKTKKGRTGAYSPAGSATRPGQVIKGSVPCGGAVLRVNTTGGKPELVAWGLRNPFGLAFAPDGRLYATENGYDERGARPVWGAGDNLWEIKPKAWYGWPDFDGGRPLSLGRRKGPLLASHPGKPPKPAAVLAVHSSASGFDFSRSPAFGHVGEAFVAEFGDMAPAVGKTLAPVGFRVARVNVETGAVEAFAVNRGPRHGPASKLRGAGLERPVSARFDREGKALYIVDFGVMTMDGRTPRPVKGSGVIWRVTRSP